VTTNALRKTSQQTKAAGENIRNKKYSLRSNKRGAAFRAKIEKQKAGKNGRK